MERAAQLATVAAEITACRRCDDGHIPVAHTSITKRGDGHFAFVVGIEPGNREVDSGEAFSGLAGKRLFSWLVEAGIGSDRDSILSNIFATSLTKCHVTKTKDFASAVRNCSPFLHRQLRAVEPRVVITLGKPPLEMLFDIVVDLKDVVGRKFREANLRNSLFPLLPTNTLILPFPHPSPLSRWTNSAENKALLQQALSHLRSEWERESEA